MPNISDYIDFRGDLSFDASPLNEIDLYIISKLGKPDYTGIVPAGFSGVCLKAGSVRLSHLL